MDSLIYFFDHLEIWGKWAAGGAAIIGFAAVFWKFFKGFLRAAKKTNIAITGFLKTLPVLEELAEYFIEDGGHSVKAALRMPNEILQKLENQEKKINEIQKEVTTNGGSSIKDVIQSVYQLSRLSSARTYRILDTSPIPTYECDPITGKCTYSNEALCNLMGISKEEMLDTGWLVCILESERQKVWDSYITALKSGIPYSQEYTIINQITLEKHRAFTEAIILTDKNGEPILLQGTVKIIN